MSEIQVRTWTNEKGRKLELDPAVFDYPWKEHLVWEAVQAYQAAGRAGTHKTKIADGFGDVDHAGAVDDPGGDLHLLLLVGRP